MQKNSHIGMRKVLSCFDAKAASLLSMVYERKKNPDSALKYFHLTVALKDSLFSHRKTMGFQRFLFAEQERQNLAALAAALVRERYRMYLSSIALAVLLATAGMIVVISAGNKYRICATISPMICMTISVLL